MLFGEMASEIQVTHHVPPDARRPLRMQCRGSPTSRRQRMAWRAKLWARSLTSRGVRRRAGTLGFLTMAVGTLLQNPLWRIATIGGLTALIALVAGAWTEVSLLADVLERGRN